MFWSNASSAMMNCLRITMICSSWLLWELRVKLSLDLLHCIHWPGLQEKKKLQREELIAINSEAMEPQRNEYGYPAVKSWRELND